MRLLLHSFFYAMTIRVDRTRQGLRGKSSRPKNTLMACNVKYKTAEAPQIWNFNLKLRALIFLSAAEDVVHHAEKTK